MTHRSNQDHVDAVADLIKKDPGLPVPNPTESRWQIPRVAIIPQPKVPDQVDIVIIGSGITGCSVSQYLLDTDPNVRVILFEARKVTSGATGRNGGHVKATPELSYGHLAPVIGKEAAREVVDFTLKNVQTVLSLAHTMDSHYAQRSELRAVEAVNLYLHRDGFNEMCHTIERFNLDNPDLAGRMQVIQTKEVQSRLGLHSACGGFAAPAGAAWPYRMVNAVFSRLLSDHKARFALHEDTAVTSVTYEEGSYTVTTISGVVKASRIVHATNGYAGHLLPGMRGVIVPVRGQMTAQRPGESFGLQGTGRSWSVHYPQGFDYITQSGSTGEIYAGGGLALADPLEELGTTRDDQESSVAIAHLIEVLRSIQGEDVPDQLISSWTGIMGFTADGMPMVGRLPREATRRDGDQEWIAAGYNGYGMANAWLCGKHIAEAILNKDKVEAVPSAYVVTTERIRGSDTKVTAEALLAELYPRR